jgi:hypothetical protein
VWNTIWTFCHGVEVKSLRQGGAIATAMVILLAGALAVGAAGPADSDPGQAPYIDGQPHSLAAHDSAWYRFEFSVMGPGFLCHFITCPDVQAGHALATIRMLAAARSGLGFEIYAPAQMRNWRKEEPVGRGSPEGNDLVWVGGADTSSTWYVRVVNDTSYGIDYRFDVAGTNLVVSRPADVPAFVPTTSGLAAWLEAQRAGTPTPTPYPAGINVNPDNAVEIDGGPHTISAGTDLWYIFTFVADARLSVRIVGGAGSGLAFEVYAPGQMGDWWKEDPLGRSAVDNGDPSWTGDPNGSRLRYVRVSNRSGRAVDFRLVVVAPQAKPLPPLPFQGY